MDEASGPQALRRLQLGLVALGLAIGLALWLHPGASAALGEGVSLLLHGDLPGLRSWGERLGPLAVLGTTALMIAQAIAAPIPAVLVTFTNSWLFGPFWGALISITQATLAAALCFLLARAYGAPLVARVLSEEAQARTQELVERHGAAAVLSARLVPIVPFDPISYVAGLTQLRLRTFVWATFLGQLPAGFTYSYLGQQITKPAQLAVFGAGAFLALLVVGLSARRVLVGGAVKPPAGPPPASGP